MTLEETLAGSLPLPVQPHYPLQEPNEALELYGGPAALADVPGSVHVTYALAPRADLLFSFSADDQEAAAAVFRGNGWRSPFLKLGSGKSQIATLGTRHDHMGQVDGIVRSPAVVTDTGRSLSRVVCHVVNFEGALGGNPLTDRRGSWAGRRSWEGAGWTITLDARSDLTAVNAKLQAEGGYAFTHVGELTRTDASLFSAAAAGRALHALQALLSFARGAWCAPMLPVGYDAEGAVAWAEWSALHCSEWFKPQTWYVARNDGALEACGRGLLEFWHRSDCHSEALWRVVGLFVTANQTGGREPLFLEARLVMAYMALELLHWLLVEDGCSAARRGKPPPATKQFSALLLRAGLPLTVPERLVHMSAYAHGRGGIDAPSLMVRIRGGIAHPSQRDGRFAPDADVLIDAVELALWWVELILLREFGYDREYGNRLDRTRWAHHVEPTPWTTAGRINEEET